MTPFYIGTVVRLEEGKHDIMVIGYGGLDASGAAYDYIGLPYPFGLTSPDTLFMFNASQVISVSYLGYASIEGQAFVGKLMQGGQSGEIKLPMFCVKSNE